MDTVDKYSVLGLDLGSNSVGWALLEYTNGQPTGLTDCGVRVFDAGTEGDVESGKDTARGVERREARQRRRQCERRGRRIENLACLLSRNGSSPKRHASLRSATGFSRPSTETSTPNTARRGSRAKPLLPVPTNSLFPPLRASTIPGPARARAPSTTSRNAGDTSNRKSGKQDEDKGTVEPPSTSCANACRRGVRDLRRIPLPRGSRQ